MRPLVGYVRVSSTGDEQKLGALHQGMRQMTWDGMAVLVGQPVTPAAVVMVTTEVLSQHRVSLGAVSGLRQPCHPRS